MTVPSGTQWIRKVSLVVQVGNQLYDLSQMKFTFATKQSDTQTPNSCFIRVYNLKGETINSIGGPGANTEFRQVTLSGGYQNAQFGLVFQGTIKQTRKGRISAVDTYFDILASDSDLAYNWAVVNQTIAAGGTYDQVLGVITKAQQEAQPGFMVGNTSGLVGGTLIRGKVLFGMARDYAADLARTNQAFWSVQNGVFQLTKRTAYLPGTAVVLNVKSGLISQPEQTEEGIRIKCLLNPQIVVGGIVQVNNAAINQTINTTNAPVAYDTYAGVQLLASVTADGFYRAYVVEHEGDTRGQDWYTNITGLSIDMSAPATSAVPAGTL